MRNLMLRDTPCKAERTLGRWGLGWIFLAYKGMHVSMLPFMQSFSPTNDWEVIPTPRTLGTSSGKPLCWHHAHRSRGGHDPKAEKYDSCKLQRYCDRRWSWPQCHFQATMLLTHCWLPVLLNSPVHILTQGLPNVVHVSLPCTCLVFSVRWLV